MLPSCKKLKQGRPSHERWVEPRSTDDVTFVQQICFRANFGKTRVIAGSARSRPSPSRLTKTRSEPDSLFCNTCNTCQRIERPPTISMVSNLTFVAYWALGHPFRIFRYSFCVWCFVHVWTGYLLKPWPYTVRELETKNKQLIIACCSWSHSVLFHTQ